MHNIKKGITIMSLLVLMFSSCKRQNKSSSVESSVSSNTSVVSSESVVSSSELSETSSSSSEIMIPTFEQYERKLNTISTVGVNYKILDSDVGRNIASISDGGLEKYPTYNVKFDGDSSLKEAVYNENETLIPSSTTFDSLDSEGNLYLNGTKINKKLYAHSSASSLYGGGLLDTEKAVKKEIEVTDPLLLGNYITGLYAPAGEIVKVEISADDLLKCGGSITVVIGQVSSRLSTVEIKKEVNFTRMPKITSKFTITEPTSYIGSYFGGPIYFIPKTQDKFKMTFTGAVEYLHYIDGKTTEAEFNRLLNTTAPFFDAEIYGQEVRFNGPRYTLYPLENATLDFENIKNAMKLWRNISYQSKRIPHGRSDNASIAMMFDTYIPVAGAAAVAFVGLDFAVCPVSWMKGALDYENFMQVGGWGVIHEFNHHHQAFGGNTNLINETTNNVVNLMEYIRYTRITEKRDYSNVSHGDALNSHNVIEYLNQYYGTDTNVFNNEKSYGMILANFGTELLEKVAIWQNKDASPDKFCKGLTEFTKFDWTYYVKDLMHLPLEDSTIAEIEAMNYPKYIPVGSLYSSSFIYSDEIGESNHALPYLCENDVVLDLKSDLNTVTDGNVQILTVTPCTNGKLTRTSEGYYHFVGDGSRKVSEFTATFKVTLGDDSFTGKVIYRLNPNADLERDYSMPLEEEFSGSLNKQLEYDSTNFTVTSSNFVPWDSNYTLDNLFDGNSNTYMHTQKNVVVSETKPVDLVIDLKEAKSFNKITFVGKGNNNKQLPTKVTISGSNDNTNFTLIGSDDELTSSGGKAYFNIPNIVSYRYVKVEVTGTNENYLALSNMIFSNSVSVNYDGYDDLVLGGNIEEVSANALYGHVLRLNENSSVEKVFENEQDVYISMDVNSSNYKVYINSKEVTLTKLFETDGYGIYKLNKKVTSGDKLKLVVLGGYIDIEDVF